MEDFLDKVCSARVIFESDLLQDFLELKKPQGGKPGSEVKKAAAEPAAEKKIDFRVTLPDRTLTTVTISEHSRTQEVFEVSTALSHHTWQVTLASSSVDYSSQSWAYC